VLFQSHQREIIGISINLSMKCKKNKKQSTKIILFVVVEKMNNSNRV